MTETPDEILELVDRYKHGQETFESSAYVEASVRQEFIDPFFRALGWDVGNQQGCDLPPGNRTHGYAA